MFSYLQKIGRALMIPVAILPAAAILMGIGYWIDPDGWGSNSMLAALFIKSGGAIIDNMSTLFAIGVAFGLSKDKSGNAALTGLVGFLVVTTLLDPDTVALIKKSTFDLLAFLQKAGITPLPSAISSGSIDTTTIISTIQNGSGIHPNITYNLMPMLDSLNHTLQGASQDTIQNFLALPQGVDLSALTAKTDLTKITYTDPAFAKINNQFIGILVGVIAAELYNRYSAVQLHKALSFFSGKRLVPILMSFAMIGVSFVLLYVWPVIYDGLVTFGEKVHGLGAIGAGIFGFANRLLIPFGLHHALNSVFWFDVAGINDIPNFLAGAKTIAEQGEAAKGVVGMYQAGFFPIMMGGLLGAALAFYKTAKPENKAKTGSIMIAAAFASFFTGVTEPLEFSFMFLAPQLYILHAILTGISLWFSATMHWMAGFGFSAGLVDLVLSSRNPLAVKWFMLILQGIVFFAIYYFSFVFFITKFKLKTPGREDAEEGSVVVIDAQYEELAAEILSNIGGKENVVAIDNCVTRLRLELNDTSLVDSDALNKIVPGILILDDKNIQIVIGTNVEFVAAALTLLVTGVAKEITSEDGVISSSNSGGGSAKIDSHEGLAKALLPLLGGKDNIVSVDNCITRLRLEVKDSTIIDEDAIKKISSGLIVPSKKAVQVIIGTEVEFVADEFRKLV